MHKFVIAVVLSVASVATVKGADGTNWLFSTSWDDRTRWVGMTYPCDGGKAYIQSGTSIKQIIDQNVSDLELSGIYFEDDSFQCLSGEDITFLGDAEFGATKLDTGYLPTVRSVRVDLQLKGDGESTFSKVGKGGVLLNKPLVDFAAVSVDGGFLVSTNVGGTSFTSLGMKLDCGALAYLGEAAGTGAAASSCGAVTAGPGAEIHVSNVDASSASLTLASLVRGEAGTLGVITDQSGALGETERVLVSGKKSEDFCAPWCVGRETSGGQAIALLGYDEVKGFVKASAVSSFSSASASDIVSLSAAVTLTENKTVASLVCENGVAPVIPKGVTLTLGGTGGKSAALVMNGAGSGTAEEVFENAGTIDFGDSEGFIWRGAKRTTTDLTHNRLTIKTPITGRNGVTFAGTGGALGTASKVVYLIGAGCARWSGPTKIIGCSVHFERSTDFPGDVYVYGGDVNDIDGAASLTRTLSPVTSQETWSRNLYLRGMGALHIPSAKAYSLTYDSVVTLLGDTRLEMSSGYIAGFRFNQPVTGIGDLEFGAGLNAKNVQTNTFAAENTYRGQTTVSDYNVLKLTDSGTFGSGPVRFGTGTCLVIDRDYAITNAITGEASVEVSDVDVGFLGGANFISSVFSRANVTLAGSTSFGELDCKNETSFAAASSGTSVAFGGEKDVTVNSRFSDGEGTLAIRKTGSGKVTLNALCGSDFSGGVTVTEGTLAFSAEMPRLRGLSFWLDGADPGTITTDGEEVVSWRSKSDGMLFTVASPSSKAAAPPIVAETLAGHSLVTFTNTSSSICCSLRGAQETTQRTVFIVAVPRANNILAGIFGEWNTDYGQRIDAVDSTGGKWRVNGVTGTTYDTRDGILTLDGVDSSIGAYLDGEPQILTMIHDRDTADNNAAIPSTFQVGLGWYFGNGGFNGAVAEAIGFDRVLTAEERKAVEDYLAKKWYARFLHGGAKVDVAAIPAGSPLSLDGEAVLDLGGVSATVSSLSGQGTICNTSDEPAVLTVTGECSFSGRLEGNVKLATSGEESSTLHLDCRDAAAVEISGGDSNVIGGCPAPLPGEGLLYWLDAAKSSTIETDGDGNILKWNSRAGSIAGFEPASILDTKTSVYTQMGGGSYQNKVAELGGMPGVYMSEDDALCSVRSANVRTLFLVFRHGYGSTIESSSLKSVWGLYNIDKGIRYQYVDNRFSLGFASGSAYAQAGDDYRINGIQAGLSTSVAVPSDETLILVVRQSASHCLNSDYSITNVLNIYKSVDRAAKQWFGEIIAYDRVLSNEQMLGIERYLTAKWKGSGYVEPDGVFNGTGSLSVNGGAGVTVTGDGTIRLSGSSGGCITADRVELTGDVVLQMSESGTVTPFTVNGILDASRAGLLVYGAKNAKPSNNLPLVDATELAGPFASTQTDHRRLKIGRTDNGYYGYTSGLVIIAR